MICLEWFRRQVDTAQGHRNRHQGQLIRALLFSPWRVGWIMIWPMRLQLYGRDHDFCLPDYSIVSNLVFEVVAQTPDRELSPWERIFVVLSTGLPVHAGHLADLYLACGCFSEAREQYLKPAHPRKLGDICWCEGRLEEAEMYYSQPKSEAQSYRSTPDDDRLIKIAFFRDQWEKVIDRFATASFSECDPPLEVCLGSSVTKAQPYLDMLAVASCRLNCATPLKILDILERVFGVSKAEWDDFRSKPVHSEARSVAKLKSRCRPRVGAGQALSLSDALCRGDTARARHVLAYIQQADAKLESAQRAVESFARTGEESTLEEFVELVTGSGVTPISHSFLFSALGHNSFPEDDGVPAERLVRLFSCHPVMDKRHLGKLLDLRFKHRLPLTANEVLTGIFQMLGRSSLPVEVGHDSKEDMVLDVPRLASCREWARIRLEDWMQSYGAKRADEVAQIWREGKAQPAAHPFYIGVIRAPDSPRNMTEWDGLMTEALMWLRQCWSREIGNSRWIAENQLYQILQRLLKGAEVIQHARPTWLEPQHFDVYVPQADIAVEYMGQQHFEPLEFFGGRPAFELVVERDRRKAALCKNHGIQLIRVRFDEDLGGRAKEIAGQILAALTGTRSVEVGNSQAR